MKTWTEEEIKQKVSDLTTELQELGWDDCIFYRYEVTGVEGDLEKVLTQDRAFSPEEMLVPTKKPIKQYGLGVSFSGKLHHPFPYTTAILSWRNYSEDERLFGKLEGEVAGTLMFEGVDEAEQIAQDIYYNTRWPDGACPIQLVERRFIRVLVPVMYL